MSRLRQRLWPNLLLSLGTVFVTGAILEGTSRILERRRPAPMVEDYIWDWQKKWDGDFYTLESDGIGWPPWEEINGDGLRDRTHAVEKPELVLRVACLGDSVTLGAGIGAADAFPQLLDGRFDREGRGVEVMNVALWGWSTRQERIAYTRIARKYRPDHVVLGVCLNDLPELQNNLTRPPWALGWLHERSALVRLAVDAPGREIGSVEELLAEPQPARVRAAFDRFFREMRLLRDEVRADGAQLSVLVFPFRFQVAPDAPRPTAQERILSFCAAEGLRCIDLLPVLAREGEAAFVDYDHLSRLGARLTADAIVSSQVIPLPPTASEILAQALRVGGRAQPDDWLRDGAPAPLARVPDLLRLLRSPAAEVRRAAVRALGTAKPSAPTTADALVDVLRGDAHEAVRAAAARALGRPSEGGDDGVRAALFDALSDPRQAVRWRAAEALAARQLTAERDLDRLASALSSPDSYVRGFASWSLGNLGAAAAPAVPALVRALEMPEGYSRAGASSALAKMGPAARAAVPALVRGLQSSEESRRWQAARTLGRIGSDAGGSLPDLIRALDDPKARVRLHAVRAIGRMGAVARGAVGEVDRLTRDPDSSVRREAEEALDALRRS
jgi:HEAT repeat protein/lysophospholipase L1-like esterase